ncbi:MAG TPA: glycine cleavage T C-terminal barrel domain-containing protein [Bryobacteraceae bacterium]|nr:glycine cleavage T C-terminal barrel domain-containing protein [Bryobacteraceae bacterium]
MTGYRELRDAAGWLELPGRGKIRMTGEDRVRLLHAMTTNHIQQLTPGTGCYAFFLTAQGRILSDVNVFCLPDSLLLDTEPQTAAAVYQHLDHYIIADDVTLEDLSGQMTTVALEGPKTGAILAAISAPLPEETYAHLDWRNRRVVRLSETGFFVFTPVAEKDDLAQELERAGAVAADAEAYRVVQLEQGKPRYGEDISERFLAQEANQPNALHFQKGCYLGQEIVERVRSRGQVHRMLMPIEIDSPVEFNDPPPPGTKLPWGEITSAAFSPALGKVVGLAYVRLEFAKPGTELQLGESHARVR